MSIVRESRDFDQEVVIVGVGHVGLTLAMALCRKGFTVLGIDINQRLVSDLNSGITHVTEQGINDELIGYLKVKRFNVVHTKANWSRSNKPITFILTVGTPLVGSQMDLTAIKKSLGNIAPYLIDGDLLILRSTVAVGTSRELVKPYVDNLNKRVLIAMCPERTVEGNALVEIENLPQVIGGIDRESAKSAELFFSNICKKTILLSSIESAELLKLANNTYRDLMFAYANELTSLAEKIGISSREIINAANHDYPRSMIAQPGPSGGPCLEKDPWILHYSGLQVGVEMYLSKAARTVNERSTYNFVKDIVKNIWDDNKNLKLGILGLSFKGSPQVKDSRGSFSKGLIDFLKPMNLDILGFEPAGEIEPLIPNLKIAKDLTQVLEECNVVIVATNHDSFKQIPELIKGLQGKAALTLVDMWSLVDSSVLPDNVEYKSWG